MLTRKRKRKNKDKFKLLIVPCLTHLVNKTNLNLPFSKQNVKEQFMSDNAYSTLSRSFILCWLLASKSYCLLVRSNWIEISDLFFQSFNPTYHLLLLFTIIISILLLRYSGYDENRHRQLQQIRCFVYTLSPFLLNFDYIYFPYFGNSSIANFHNEHTAQYQPASSPLIYVVLPAYFPKKKLFS